MITVRLRNPAAKESRAESVVTVNHTNSKRDKISVSLFEETIPAGEKLIIVQLVTSWNVFFLLRKEDGPEKK